MPRSRSTPKLRCEPLTPARWPELEKLFGPRGACGGCWCMYWKPTQSEFAAGFVEAARRSDRQPVMRRRIGARRRA